MPPCWANQCHIWANGAAAVTSYVWLRWVPWGPQEGQCLLSAARVRSHYTDAKDNYRLVRPCFRAIAVSSGTASQYRFAGLSQSSR
jgi:hypothetical protein